MGQPSCEAEQQGFLKKGRAVQGLQEPESRPVDAPEEVPGSVNDVVEFLGSAEGRRAYQFWCNGILTNARVVREYGSEILEAFLATRIMAG